MTIFQALQQTSLAGTTVDMCVGCPHGIVCDADCVNEMPMVCDEPGIFVVTPSPHTTVRFLLGSAMLCAICTIILTSSHIPFK